MKKINVLFVVAIIAMALVMSCKGNPPAQQNPNLPVWINEMPPEDMFWGIGSANLQNMELARQTATTRARRSVAEQISVQIQGMLTDYASEAGIVGDSRSIQAIENITRSLVNLNLAGATVDKMDEINGTWWVRVGIKKADAHRPIIDTVNSAAADYAEFRADQSLRQLDYQLQQTQSRPTIVGD